MYGGAQGCSALAPANCGADVVSPASA